MTYSAWHHGRPALDDRASDRPTWNRKRWDRIVDALTNPDVVAIVTICAVGLLLTFAGSRLT
jgi:hypothetical protein